MTNMRTVQINNRLNGYMVKTEKFKTDLIGIYVKRRLLKSEVGLNTLLSRLLVRGTQAYPTTKKLNTYLESCYGMILVSDMVKYGDHHILQIKLQFPDPKHIKDKDIFDNALKVIEEVLFRPLTEEGKFNQAYFDQEKRHLMDEIKSRVNDKMSYSLERCIECMYEGQDYANYVYGDVEDIEAITNEDLYKHYLKLLKTSKVDVSIMGDIDFDYVKSAIEALPFVPCGCDDFEAQAHKVNDLKVVHEDFNVKQGKLVLGYDTPFDHTHDLYEASVLAYYILGGGPNSILFKELREEHSLCYYVYTKSDKFKGCMFVGAGIESENYDRVLDMIKDQIEILRVTEVKTDQLDLARDAMIASIRSLSDYPNSFINFLYTEVLDKPVGGSFDMDEMISRYEKVALSDIKKVFQALTLDTIYFINGGDK